MVKVQLPTMLVQFCTNNNIDTKRVLGEINAELEQAEVSKHAKVTGAKLSGKILKSGKDNRKFKLTISGQGYEVEGHTVPLVTYSFFFNLQEFCDKYDNVMLPTMEQVPADVARWIQKLVNKPAVAVPAEQNNPTEQPA